MTDMYEKFKTFEKNLASEARARPQRRLDRKLDKLAPWEIGTSPQSEKYRTGWDRIFGSKTGNTVQDESST